MIDSHDPDFVVMDLLLPNVTGTAVLDSMKD
jgi:CheY-like chemotaxis protein